MRVFPMKRLNLFAMGPALLPLVTLFFSCSGEKAASRALEAYTPPAIHRASTLSHDASGPAAEKDPAGIVTAFEAQRERLLRLKKNWETDLTKPDGAGKAFFTPNDALSKKLSPAFTDDVLAMETVGNGFSLESLEVLAWGRDSRIKAAVENVRASLEGYRQAANLDDILRRYAAFTAAAMNGPGSGRDMESIDARFPFPGILALKGDIVAETVRAEREELEIARRTAVTRARQIYWGLLYIGSAGETTRKTLTLLDGFEASSRKRYESGKAPISDIISIRDRKEKLKEEWITITEQGRNLEAELKALLLLPASARIGRPARREPAAVVPSLEELTEMALAHRQELKIANHRIRRTQLMIEMGETDVYPGFSQNLALSENRAVNPVVPFSSGTSTSMAAGEGPVLPFSGLADAYLSETRKWLASQNESLTAAKAETAWGVRMAWFQVDRARRQLRLYREKLSKISELNFNLSSSAYESGKLPFSEAFEALVSRLETRLSEEKWREDLGVSIARLKEAVGVSWPEH